MRAVRVQVLVLGLVAVLLGSALVWQLSEWRGGHRTDSRRADAVKVADAQVIDLTTLDSKTVGAKLKAIARRTTGDFSQQLDGITNTFVKVVNDKKLVATGTINSSAVTSISGSKAKVIVASSASVTQGTGKAATRNYRIRVDLVRSKSVWKVDGMEFVQ